MAALSQRRTMYFLRQSEIGNSLHDCQVVIALHNNSSEKTVFMEMTSSLEQKLKEYMDANDFESAIKLCVDDKAIYNQLAVLNWIKNTFMYSYKSGYTRAINDVVDWLMTSDEAYEENMTNASLAIAIESKFMRGGK